MLTDMENKFYYIYEIWGKKIGCAEDVSRRMMQQKIYDGRYEILEVHTDVVLASQREIILQKQYGYRVDSQLYYKVLESQLNINHKEAASKVDWTAVKAKVDWSTALKKHRTPKIDYKKLGDAQRNKPKHTKEYIETRYKAINQYDLEGNFIKRWNSIKSALEHYKGDIQACCKGKQKTSAGFIWKYAN